MEISVFSPGLYGSDKVGGGKSKGGGGGGGRGISFLFYTFTEGSVDSYFF